MEEEEVSKERKSKERKGKLGNKREGLRDLTEIINYRPTEN